MRVAQVSGVHVAVATADHAIAGRLLPIRIARVPVPQRALIVHLTQTLGLHRIVATVLNALIGLDAYSGFDWADGQYVALELRVMRLAIPPRFVGPSAVLVSASVVLFAHKKSPSGLGLLPSTGRGLLQEPKKCYISNTY